MHQQQRDDYISLLLYIYTHEKLLDALMADNMKVSLVNYALNMAIEHRNLSSGLLWHTDRNSQYTSYSHKDLLQKYNIVQSISKKGDC